MLQAFGRNLMSLPEIVAIYGTSISVLVVLVVLEERKVIIICMFRNNFVNLVVRQKTGNEKFLPYWLC